MGIREGNSVWNEFLHATQSSRSSIRAAALFDHHHVVDTLSRPEACTVGVELDHNEVVVSYLCSFGREHRQKPFFEDVPYRPMIAELDGFIFTDYRVGRRDRVDVYREPWMTPSCVGVSGDKGQVASLLRRPAILFDDKEDNVRLLRARSTEECTLDGIIVRRGRKADDPVECGFVELSNCNDWVTAIEAFGARPQPAHILARGSPPIDLSRRDLFAGCGYQLKFFRTIGRSDTAVRDVSRTPRCAASCPGGPRTTTNATPMGQGARVPIRAGVSQGRPGTLGEGGMGEIQRGPNAGEDLRVPDRTAPGC